MLKSAKVQSNKIKAKPETPFIAALRKFYRVNDYIILEQIPIHQEGKSRVADALVIGTWASRDLEIRGFEIKTARQDWLNELNNPEKSDVAAIYCDTWSLLAYPGVADKHEIPVVWGHYELDQTIKVLKEPQRLQPKPITRELLLNLFKKLNEQAFLNVETISNEHEYKRGYLDGKNAGAREADQASGYLESRLSQHTRTITALQGKLRDLGIGAANEADVDTHRFVSGLVSKWKNRIPELERLINLMSSGSIQETISKMNALLARTKEIESFLLPKIQGLQEFINTVHTPTGDVARHHDLGSQQRDIRSELASRALLNVAKAKLVNAVREYSSKRGTAEEEAALKSFVLTVNEIAEQEGFQV